MSAARSIAGSRRTRPMVPSTCTWPRRSTGRPAPSEERMETPPGPENPPHTETPATEGKSDLKVVLQFFIVPLSLVAVLVSVFFGLQVLRSRRPDAEGALRSLQSYDGLLARWVGDVKRWQSGYDLSLLMRAEDGEAIRRTLPRLTAAFRDARERGDDR